MNAEEIVKFLDWRKHHGAFKELSDVDLEFLFPLLEDYAQFRLHGHEIAARSNIRVAYANIAKLERSVNGYRNRLDIDQHVQQLTKYRTWRWWMAGKVWWHTANNRWRAPLVHARVLLGIARRDYATGRRFEWASIYQSLPKRYIHRYGKLRMRWEMLLHRLPIDRRWATFESLRTRVLRKQLLNGLIAGDRTEPFE